MEMFQRESIGNILLVLPLIIVRSTAVTAVDATSTPASSEPTIIIFIAIPVVIGLVCIVAFFVWKRQRNRKRPNGRCYNLPSPTVRSGLSHEISNDNTVLDRRMDSAYSKHSRDRKIGRSEPHHPSHPKPDRPPQWPARGAPTYTRQQQQQPQYQHQPQYEHQQHQYQPQYQPPYQNQYAPEESFPPPPPPPPEIPMLEPHEDQGPGLLMMELLQSRMWGKSSVEESQSRQTDPAVIARTQETAAKVMADLAEDPEFEESWIPYDSLYFTRAISKGAFGEVWLAQLENTQVAVKKILDEKRHDVNEIECFGEEIKLLALFKHPKIVGFIGVSWSDKQDLCAVTEYMAKGDLYGYLKRRKGKLNWPDHKVWLAGDIAEALVYLHSLSPKIIHRDLKSKNILLDNKYRAKLSDFGISRKRSAEETMTAGVGTIYWTAPEVLMGKKYTEKADIFSFGIVMSEMDTCEEPYSDKYDSVGKELQSMKIIQLVIRQGLRPSFLKDCPEEVKALADRCLDTNPDERPSAPELLDALLNIQDELQQ